MEQRSPLDEKPGGRPPGLGERLDAALTARGFTTRGLRVRAVVTAVVSVAVAAGVGVFLTDNLTNTFGPDSVCEGAVSADALNDALGPGTVGEQKFGDGHLRSGTAICMATVSYGMFGNNRSVTVELRKNSSLSVLADDTEARLFSASANGGAAGAAFDHRAWALLPGDCDSGLRVTVRSSGGDRPGARKLAGLSVSTANRIAMQRRCGSSPVPAPHELSETGKERDLDPSATCGLPGLTVSATPQAPGLRETVTTATDPMWACRIHSNADPRSSATFTIGTDPRLLTPSAPDGEPGFGRARWVEPGEMVVTCQGRPTYFRMDWSDFRDPVPDSDAAWKQFLTAGGRAIGCEPIM
ncbi:hypothetical protein [Kitasatospora aureofaciens]|uniref:hypothetical protein n=1 Tax=Kitasatospora aureofaciens TaxID=1894 RepID=UPI0037CA0916